MASPHEVPSYPSPRGQCWIVPYSVCALLSPQTWILVMFGSGRPPSSSWEGFTPIVSPQGVCFFTNRISPRTWACAASRAPTVLRPASGRSPSSWRAVPGTSVVKTAKANTCSGTSRSVLALAACAKCCGGHSTQICGHCTEEVHTAGVWLALLRRTWHCWSPAWQ